MEFTGKITIFVEDVKGKEGNTFKKFSTTVSSKDKNGKYINKSLEVQFNRENFSEERTNKWLSTKCYKFEVKSAWLGVRKYTKLVGETEEDHKVIYLYIDQAEPLSVAEIKSKKPIDNDLPF